MKIAIFFCLFALAHARHRGLSAYSASGLGSNLRQVGGLGYSGNLGIGFGTNLLKRRYGYGWQNYLPSYYGGYASFGSYGSNSGYTSPGLPPFANSPYNSGFSGNGVYGSAGPLGSPTYGGYGYGGNGYGYGNTW